MKNRNEYSIEQNIVTTKNIMTAYVVTIIFRCCFVGDEYYYISTWKVLKINKIIPFSILKYFLLSFYRESRVLGNSRRCTKKRKGAYSYVLSVILD